LYKKQSVKFEVESVYLKNILFINAFYLLFFGFSFVMVFEVIFVRYN